MSRGLLGCIVVGGIVIFLALVIGLWFVGVRNHIVDLDQSVEAQWGQVQTAYQRRYDLIPNLVQTVQGAANFEKSTLVEVTEARAKVGQVTAGAGAPPANLPNSPEAMQQFEQAQAGLSGALSRLLVVVERYPELKSNENFLQLQSQLEGTENRINVERRKFNEEAQKYNTYILKFPASMVAGMSGFQKKAYFQGAAGSSDAPKVNFDFGKK